MRIATNTEMSNIQSQINQQVEILNRPGAKVEWSAEKYFTSNELANNGVYSVRIDVPSITTFSNRTYQMIACFMGSANPTTGNHNPNPILTIDLFSTNSSIKKHYDFGWRTNCGSNISSSVNHLISGSDRVDYPGPDNVVCQLINKTGYSLNFQENSPTESKLVVFVISYLKTTEEYS